MKLIVLGSGTAVPHPRRRSAGYWLETSGGTVLLDCSASVVHRMAEENLNWADLDAIWISHFHLDHCAGLAPFLFAARVAMQDRTKSLRIFGPKGLRNLIDLFDEAGKKKLLDQPFPVDIVEVEPLEMFQILDGVDTIAYSTQHTDESHAIYLRDGDTTFVYTSDTGYDEALATFARKVDLLLMECSFVDEKATDKHLNLAEAVRLIRMAEPRNAMLTHFYAEWDEVDFEKEVRRLAPGCEVIQAEDGLRFSVSTN
jgi:ribonuclease BN (tRNA processing enzyme)